MWFHIAIWGVLWYATWRDFISQLFCQPLGEKTFENTHQSFNFDVIPQQIIWCHMGNPACDSSTIIDSGTGFENIGKTHRDYNRGRGPGGGGGGRGPIFHFSIFLIFSIFDLFDLSIYRFIYIYIYIERERERALGCETLVSSRENYSKTIPKTNVLLLKNWCY